jgi:hypothetical protein
MSFFLIPTIVFAVSGFIHSVPLSDGGICGVIQEELGEYTSVLRIESVDSGGAVRWTAGALPVRNDAVSGLVSESSDGKILFASAFGEGYTDILLQLFNGSGDLLNSDTISLVCYDTPLALVSTSEGFALAWDSWSGERGVHIAFLDGDGTVVRTVFVTGTVNPGPAALAVFHSSVIIGVSPLLAQDEILFCYSEDGERLWADRPVLPEGAELIESIAPSGDGTLSVLWKSLPDADGRTHDTVTEHSVTGSGV